MKWISVKEQQPPVKGYFFAYGTMGRNCPCGKDPDFWKVRWCGDEFVTGEYDCPVDITHWLLPTLPEPPKGISEK